MGNIKRINDTDWAYHAFYKLYDNDMNLDARLRSIELEPESKNDSHYQHIQVEPNNLWTIHHNLGKYPAVFCVNSAGEESEGEVEHINMNTLTVLFSAPQSGESYLN